MFTRSLWAIAIVALIVTASEFAVRAWRHATVVEMSQSAVEQAYEPFSVQHLHPQYFFFFPLDLAQRQAINNAVCSVDADGFREPGLKFSSGRPLAVLLGGSTAFGQFASSNATTITAYLNQLQQDFHFVSAGVPGWTSTQELIRMTVQIADLRPALVIALDGYNDATVANLRSPRTGQAYPAGTPESFGDLERRVDDIRAGRIGVAMPSLFPALTRMVRDFVDLPDGPGWTYRSMSPAQVSAAADAYLANQRKMAALARAIGARFMTVVQPIWGLHGNRPDPEHNEELKLFYQRLIAEVPDSLEFHDFSKLWERRFSVLPERDIPAPEGGVFVDAIHLSDFGNRLVAEALLDVIRRPVE